MYNTLLNEINNILKNNNLQLLENYLSKWYWNHLGYWKTLNHLLNYYKVNDPNQTLYLGSTVRDFFKWNLNYKYNIENNIYKIFNDFYYYVNSILDKKIIVWKI